MRLSFPPFCSSPPSPLSWAHALRLLLCPALCRLTLETQMSETLPSGASCPGRRRDALQDRPTQAQMIIKGTVCMVMEIAFPRPRPAARALPPRPPSPPLPSAFLPRPLPLSASFARPWAPPPARRVRGVGPPPAHPTPARTNPRGVGGAHTGRAKSRGPQASRVSPRKFEKAKRTGPKGLVSPRRGISTANWELRVQKVDPCLRNRRFSLKSRGQKGARLYHLWIQNLK